MKSLRASIPPGRQPEKMTLDRWLPTVKMLLEIELETAIDNGDEVWWLLEVKEHIQYCDKLKSDLCPGHRTQPEIDEIFYYRPVNNGKKGR
jgi:hypothetical protein